MLPKTILITGASRGIGRATADLLVRQGHTVFGTSRTPDRYPDPGFPLLPLDVRDGESVRACVETVRARAGRLDVLINNAGYSILAPVEETPLDAMQALFDTHVFGVHRMIQAALPIMRAQRSGLVVNVGSLAGQFAVPCLGVYAATKFALAGYSEALRHEVRAFGIRVTVVEPGDIRTDIETLLPAGTIPDYDGMRERVRDIHLANMANGPGPEIVARAIARIVTKRSPRARYAVGKEGIGVTVKRFTSAGMLEWFVRRLYKL
jgi:NAD(P)-dependent dehydrogenase (short-subunit alcohol dehydrogenase family)